MNHESDLCTNVSERLCLLTIWHCCEVTKHMHASMPNASFNALLRSNCLRFRRWVFNICMGKKLPKTMAWSFWIWLFVTFNFHPTLQMTSYLHPIPNLVSWNGVYHVRNDPTVDRGQGRFKTNSRGASRETLPVPRIGWWGEAGGRLFETFFFPPTKFAWRKVNPLEILMICFKWKYLNVSKAIGQFYMVWYFFSQSTLTWFFLVPKASTWFYGTGWPLSRSQFFGATKSRTQLALRVEKATIRWALVGVFFVRFGIYRGKKTTLPKTNSLKPKNEGLVQMIFPFQWDVCNISGSFFAVCFRVFLERGPTGGHILHCYLKANGWLETTSMV